MWKKLKPHWKPQHTVLNHLINSSPRLDMCRSSNSKNTSRQTAISHFKDIIRTIYGWGLAGIAGQCQPLLFFSTGAETSSFLNRHSWPRCALVLDAQISQAPWTIQDELQHILYVMAQLWRCLVFPGTAENVFGMNRQRSCHAVTIVTMTYSCSWWFVANSYQNEQLTVANHSLSWVNVTNTLSHCAHFTKLLSEMKVTRYIYLSSVL